MPKTPATKKRKIENAVQEFGKDAFTYEKHNKEERLWCKLCSTPVNYEDNSKVRQHVYTRKHQEAITSIKAGQLLQLSATEMVALKHAPVTSVDVERSFSTFKAVLRENRMRFNITSLCYYMVVHCNDFK